MNHGGCDANADCSSGAQGVSCTCRSGYTGDGIVCAPAVGECAMANGGCDLHATCAITSTGHSCTCNPGYTGDGVTCSDINECLTSNGGCATNAVCTNTPGSRTCSCDTGYMGDGGTCSDIDECLMNNGGCPASATCANIPGSRTCSCNAGYTGDGGTCSDIDECLTSNGGCATNATCTNTPGSRTCSCNGGYTGDGGTCTDVCLTNNGGCDPHATCSISTGSRTCACNTGFTGDGLTCADTSPPTVTLSVPSSPRSGSVMLTGTATDNVGVVKTELWVDGVVAQTFQPPMSSWSWNTASVADGPHTLVFKAYDAAANVGASAPASLSTCNGVPAGAAQLGATIVSFTEVDLAWPAAPGVCAQSYVVYRGGVKIATLGAAARSYKDTAVPYASPQTYAVRAVDPANVEHVVEAPASAGDGSAFVSSYLPTTTVEIGDPFSAAFAFKNTGQTTWARGPYEAGTTSATTRQLGADHLTIYGVNPGDIQTFWAKVNAPSAVGPFSISWQMTLNGVPFGAPTPPLALSAVQSPGTPDAVGPSPNPIGRMPRFRILIDVNQMNSSDVAAGLAPLAVDGVWAITENYCGTGAGCGLQPGYSQNSPTIHASQWPAILKTLNAAAWTVTEDESAFRAPSQDVLINNDFRAIQRYIAPYRVSDALVYQENFDIERHHPVFTNTRSDFEAYAVPRLFGQPGLVFSRTYTLALTYYPPYDPQFTGETYASAVDAALQSPSAAGLVFEQNPRGVIDPSNRYTEGLLACLASPSRRCYMLMPPNGDGHTNHGDQTVPYQNDVQDHAADVAEALAFLFDVNRTPHLPANNPNLFIVVAAYARWDPTWPACSPYCPQSHVGFQKDDLFPSNTSNSLLAAARRAQDLRNTLVPIPPTGAVNSGTMQGWTLDPQAYAASAAPITVEVWADGQIGQGGTLVGSATANLPWPGLNDATGYLGDHGFNFTVPQAYRGAPHSWWLYGVSAAGVRGLLVNSGFVTAF